MTGSTVEMARGRWCEILPRLGVETRYLVNKHGPCPICGEGKDRFRFDDKNGEGTYFCSQCGPGTGLILLRKLRGWDYATACREVDKIIGRDPPPATRPQPQREPDKAGAIRRLLAEATDPSVVDAYLSRRGLTVTSQILRGHPRCPYFDETSRLVGRYPAVIAPIVDINGKLRSAMRIYDTDPRRKKTMPVVETIAGAAVRLHDPSNGELGVAEGIETALAGYELTGIPTWAAISDSGLKSFVSPNGLRRLVVFADNDASFAGQAAAYALAQRMRRDGIDVEVRTPETVGADWLDVLTGDAAR